MSARIFVRPFCTIALFSLMAFAWLAMTRDASAQDARAGENPSATVTMSIGRGAMLLSATGGNGVLSFQGQTHKFKLGGMGIGLIGFSKVEAEGEVYNLSKLEDFPGAYIQGSADYAAGEGQGVLWLKNTKGVVLKLRSKIKGLSLAVGGEGLLIQMGEIKK